MYDDILVPTDGAPGIEGITTLALEVATACGSTVHSVAVTDTRLEPEGMREQDRKAWRASAKAQGEAAVSEIRDRAEAAGLDTETAIWEGTPYEELLAYAERQDIDLAALAIYGGEATYPAKLGSTTERVTTFGDVPVLTARPAEDVEVATLADRYETILVPTDGSEYAERAAEQAVAFAAEADASIHAAHVIDLNAYDQGDETAPVLEVAEEAGQRAVNDVAAMAAEASVPASTTVERGEPAQTIADVAETEAASLVVLGVRGLRSPSDRLLGSTTSRVIRRSRVPVLVTN